MSIHLISNGKTIAKVAGKAGLNYGSAVGAQAGFQRMELLAPSGSVLLAASGGRCISDGCPDCIYNMNSQVVELTEDNGFEGTCPQAICEKLAFAHYMVLNQTQPYPKSYLFVYSRLVQLRQSTLIKILPRLLQWASMALH